MATLSPLTPYVYNKAKVSNVSEVIAPPYDVINSDYQEQLYQRSPHNVIRLELNKGDLSGDRYIDAAAYLRKFIDENVIVQEGPCMYWMAQTFQLPSSDKIATRKGIFAKLLLEPFGNNVLPHEKTLSGPKADRLELMKKTAMNFSPIFGLANIDGAFNMLASQERKENEYLSFRFEDIDHRVWKIGDTKTIQNIQKMFEPAKIVIADGHHRYETALHYHQWYADNHQNVENSKYVLIYISFMDDPGLVILPTHRLVHSLDNFDYQSFLSHIKEEFIITELNRDFSIAVDTFYSSKEKGIHFCLFSPDQKPCKLTYKDKQSKALDLEVLHNIIFEKLLHISKEAQEKKVNLDYVKSAREVESRLQNKSFQAAFLVNSTPIESMLEVVSNHKLMPQKSTYFYPKIPTGLFFNPLA